MRRSCSLITNLLERLLFPYANSALAAKTSVYLRNNAEKTKLTEAFLHKESSENGLQETPIGEEEKDQFGRGKTEKTSLIIT